MRAIWWHHQMEAFSALLALLEGNPQVTSGFPSQRPVTWSFDVFLDLLLDKGLSKQSRRWWFEMPSRSLWCHWNVFSDTNSMPGRDEVLFFFLFFRPRWAWWVEGNSWQMFSSENALKIIMCPTLAIFVHGNERWTNNHKMTPVWLIIDYRMLKM